MGALRLEEKQMFSEGRNKKDMRNKVLADRVRYFKEDERGVAIMCLSLIHI